MLQLRSRCTITAQLKWILGTFWDAGATMHLSSPCLFLEVHFGIKWSFFKQLWLGCLFNTNRSFSIGFNSLYLRNYIFNAHYKTLTILPLQGIFCFILLMSLCCTQVVSLVTWISTTFGDLTILWLMVILGWFLW